MVNRLEIAFIIVSAMLISSPCQVSAQMVGKQVESGRESSENTERPNIILIVADDLGYGDVGILGGEIDTPNIDALASGGIKLTRFHTQASCSPTRSILLTGVDNHLNGLGTMSEDLQPHHTGVPGYEGYLNQRVVTVATLLKQVGYHTYMSGKWHLGFEQSQRPFARGFEQTFALLDGTANHYTEAGPNAAKPRATYTQNGEEVARPPGYSSDLFTDQLIAQIDQPRGDGRPFFAYLSFTAPHWPLQAPRHSIDKYISTCNGGWDHIRAQRFARMKALGLIPPDVELPPRLPGVPAWDTLSEDEKRVEARKMAVYAAMVDNLDANIGRLIAYLKSVGEYDNSLIVFMSDNGADPYDRSERGLYKDWIGDNYNNSYDNIGNGDSFTFYGPGWAQVGSVHLRHYKFLPSEGGTRAPFIIRYPNIGGAGKNMPAFASILDITPTLLDMAQVPLAADYYHRHQLYQPRGRSLIPYLGGETSSVYDADEAVAFELFGHASVYMGPWKSVRLRQPWGSDRWSLYDVEADPSESVDLSNQQPDVLKKMVAAYSRYQRANNVINEPEGVTAYPAKPRYIEQTTGAGGGS